MRTHDFSVTARVFLGCISVLLAVAVVPAAGSEGEPQVDVIWGVTIPVRDGVRLNATLYRPVEMPDPLPVAPRPGGSVNSRCVSVLTTWSSRAQSSTPCGVSHEGAQSPLLQGGTYRRSNRSSCAGAASA
jgi:hypothetical protein